MTRAHTHDGKIIYSVLYSPRRIAPNPDLRKGLALLSHARASVTSEVVTGLVGLVIGLVGLVIGLVGLVISCV